MSSKVPLPRGPVLDWSSMTGPCEAGIPAVDDLPYQLRTTSGRAALFQAMRALQLAPGSAVLVPSYHCPTMVAPVVHAGLLPMFYALDERGAPQLSALDDRDLTGVRAIIVAHYFGRARSLAAERIWCDERGIALIEDCAHCLFGQAGERPVGAWGDFAIASLTKFLPVPEAGLLASAHRPIVLPPLPRQGLKAQLKGIVDVLEHAHQHAKLHGINWVLGAMLALKNGRRSQPVKNTQGGSSVPEHHASCDMSRVQLAPVTMAITLARALPRRSLIKRRQQNCTLLRERLLHATGARLLFDTEPSPLEVPYALPLWVDDADTIYRALRHDGMPVFRWDQQWASAPPMSGDHGPLMGNHVLQLLCHQSLTEADIDKVANTVKARLGG